MPQRACRCNFLTCFLIQGFELLLVGHSLGGATAALLGMLLRQDSEKVLGLYPEKIRVVGIGTPPCLSKVLAARCRDFTTTLVLQVIRTELL